MKWLLWLLWDALWMVVAFTVLCVTWLIFWSADTFEEWKKDD